MRRQVALLVVVMLSTTLVGCGGRNTAQVSGLVRYADGTLLDPAYSFIQLRPAEGTTAEIRKAASSRIAEDGAFKLYTRRPGDGVFCGKYKIVLSVTSGPFDPVSQIPIKYTQVSTSPLSVDVDSDIDDLIVEIDRL